jgi:uncharacterized membrane protein
MLTLAMQSGAFLQLVVTLTALVARLAHLSSGMRRVLSTLHAESMLLLSALHVRSERAFARASTPIRRLTNAASCLLLSAYGGLTPFGADASATAATGTG